NCPPPATGTGSLSCPGRRSPRTAGTPGHSATSAGWTSASRPTRGSRIPSGGAGRRRATTPPGAELGGRGPRPGAPPRRRGWSWLDLRWTTPLAWWLAWDPGSVPVGGSDWHRPSDLSAVGTPTTWVECEAADPAAILAGLRAGRVAISARRDGPVLLRCGDELIA